MLEECSKSYILDTAYFGYRKETNLDVLFKAII